MERRTITNVINLHYILFYVQTEFTSKWQSITYFYCYIHVHISGCFFAGGVLTFGQGSKVS